MALGVMPSSFFLPFCCVSGEVAGASSACGSSACSRSSWWRLKPPSSCRSKLNKKPEFVVSLVRRKAGCVVLASTAVSVAEVKQGRCGGLELADRAWAHQRRTYDADLRRRLAAASSGRKAAAPFPPGLWRQFNFWSEAMARCCGSLAAPSGVVPGDDEVVLDRWLWTRSLFLFSLGSFLQKSRDLFLISSLSRVLFVICTWCYPLE